MDNIDAVVEALEFNDRNRDDPSVPKLSKHLIAQHCHISGTKFNQIYDFWHEHNRRPPPSRLGRPPKITPDVEAFILGSGSGPITDAQLVQEIINHFPELEEISRATANRWRKDLHFEFKPAKQRQALTLYEKVRRVQFAYSMIYALGNDLEKIRFSDESRICFKNDSKTLSQPQLAN